ncbi:MAG: 3-hydroxyacyl-CoA dehydrogenase family protein [Bacteroidota bacterium]
MWVLVGASDFLKELLHLNDLAQFSDWQVAPAGHPLPPASVYLDLSGRFALDRPDHTPADAWWVVHAPTHTLSELPARTIRLNAWPGFAAGKQWEMVWNGEEAKQLSASICTSLQKEPIEVPDQIGFIGARVLASVINEAFLLQGEGAASEEDIDLAMKLGTNYPWGPFEWTNRIGWKETYSLLIRLSEEDPRYQPAPHWAKYL